MTIEIQHRVTTSDDGQHALADARDVIEAIARGELVVIVDDENRENEGDLIVAADFADASAINFMITHGRGLVCMSLTAERAAELNLPPMVQNNQDHMGTAFTVSIDGSPDNGVRTGISAAERARTIELARTGSATDLVRPGHLFPLVARSGGVLERPGHTEASVALARLAGLTPSGVIVEIIGEDGEMLRLAGLYEFAREHGLLISSIELLQAHLRETGVVA